MRENFSETYEMNGGRDSEIILSIDGSGRQISLRIARGALELGSWSGDSPASKTEDVLARTEVILKANNIEKKQIAVVVVSKSENDSTGGKIALAIARGLARAGDSRLIEVPIFRALLNEAAGGADGEYITVTPVGKNRMQWRLFKKENSIFRETAGFGVKEASEKGKLPDELPDKLSDINFEKIIFTRELGEPYRFVLSLPDIRRESIILSEYASAELMIRYYHRKCV